MGKSRYTNNIIWIRDWMVRIEMDNTAKHYERTSEGSFYFVDAGC